MSLDKYNTLQEEKGDKVSVPFVLNWLTNDEFESVLKLAEKYDKKLYEKITNKSRKFDNPEAQSVVCEWFFGIDKEYANQLLQEYKEQGLPVSGSFHREGKCIIFTDKFGNECKSVQIE